MQARQRSSLRALCSETLSNLVCRKHVGKGRVVHDVQMKERTPSVCVQYDLDDKGINHPNPAADSIVRVYTLFWVPTAKSKVGTTKKDFDC